MTVHDVIESVLHDNDLHFERVDDAFVVNLPGTRRLKTACWLRVGEHALSVEAFVVRKPDENVEQFYRYLLEHNARMYAVAWSIDSRGDVYLTGRVPLSSVSPAEIDRILGAVLEYADGSFNAHLTESAARTEVSKRLRIGNGVCSTRHRQIRYAAVANPGRI